MSVVRQFEENGVEITEDSTQPLGQRTQRHFKRVIAAVRAAEADYIDQINEANERCREAQDKVITLQNHLSKVEKELAAYRLKDKMNEIPSLSTVDRKQLLESTN